MKEEERVVHMHWKRNGNAFDALLQNVRRVLYEVLKNYFCSFFLLKVLLVLIRDWCMENLINCESLKIRLSLRRQ